MRLSGLPRKAERTRRATTSGARLLYDRCVERIEDEHQALDHRVLIIATMTQGPRHSGTPKLAKHYLDCLSETWMRCERLTEHLRREAGDLKEVVAEQTLELRLLKKSMTWDGGSHE